MCRGRLHVPWAPSLRLLRLLVLAMPGVERRARDVVIRDRRRELGQVLRALLSYRLETRGQRDQPALAEGGAKEGNAEWNPKHVGGRHLHVWIAARGAETRAAEHEVIAIEQIRRPGGVVRRRDHRVEIELRERRIDAADRCGLIHRQRLIVGRADRHTEESGEPWIGDAVVGTGWESYRLCKDVLSPEGHLRVGVCIVEVDCRLERAV